MTIYHTHHIIPKYMGGTDEPDNLVTITVEEHAKMHLELYEKYGDYRDLLAYQGLSKQINQDELLSRLYSENGKNMVKKRKENGWVTHNKGVPMKEEHKLRLSAIKKGVPNIKGRVPKTEEAKLNMRIARSKIMTDEYKQKLSESNQGQRWYSNHYLKLTCMFNVNELPDNEDSGWFSGRKYHPDGEIRIYNAWNKK